MTDIQDWIAICEVKARYCRLMDTKQWDAWRDLFTEDYELDVSEAGGPPPIKGRTEALGMAMSFVLPAITVHQVHCPEITINGDTAEGIWAMQDRVVFGPQGPSLSGFGHYHDRFRRLDGVWKISASKLTRLHVDMVAIG
ncbi:Bile acid 7-alpha dehydratase [Brevundimonas sp. NIBR10]|uniref:nuclear transport factor 2 family protein n=1 Tax=Brevundimonas sp. NIBR10 TaxID=3015997 RepID=UPI0022F16535|nr:nuclear transport factor 2 family protein [Brevundimonas sp. NIBR10]WGM47467.1 Bile acid 7-alpha dehydratase [Brevundimonas sp. NIBR10]